MENSFIILGIIFIIVYLISNRVDKINKKQIEHSFELLRDRKTELEKLEKDISYKHTNLGKDIDYLENLHKEKVFFYRQTEINLNRIKEEEELLGEYIRKNKFYLELIRMKQLNFINKCDKIEIILNSLGKLKDSFYYEDEKKILKLINSELPKLFNQVESLKIETENIIINSFGVTSEELKGKNYLIHPKFKFSKN